MNHPKSLHNLSIATSDMAFNSPQVAGKFGEVGLEEEQPWEDRPSEASRAYNRHTSSQLNSALLPPGCRDRPAGCFVLLQDFRILVSWKPFESCEENREPEIFEALRERCSSL